MANKIKYGIKNVYYAVLSSGTYGTPVALPGAVSISLAPQGNLEKFYADNVVYFRQAVNNGYEGDLELAYIPDAFRTAILGETLDGTSSILIENADVTTVEFALGFQFEGDDQADRFWFYNCTATRPEASGDTKEDTIEPKTETITISTTPDDDGYVRVRSTSDTPSATYEAWFSAVVLPTAAG